MDTGIRRTEPRGLLDEVEDEDEAETVMRYVDPLAPADGIADEVDSEELVPTIVSYVDLVGDIEPPTMPRFEAPPRRADPPTRDDLPVGASSGHISAEPAVVDSEPRPRSLLGVAIGVALASLVLGLGVGALLWFVQR